jgi:hypothetical protein
LSLARLWPRRPIRGCTPSRRSCPPCGCTTIGARSCTSGSRGCRSTTCPGVRGRSSPLTQATSQGASARGRLVELGAGTSKNTRLLLDELDVELFAPLDVSARTLPRKRRVDR